MTITVLGTPGPQGSKSAKGRTKTGRVILVESSQKVKPWREAIKWAVIELRKLGVAHVAGPLAVEMTFTLPKPKSAPKRRQTWPDRTPDVDKLARSTADALTQAGAIEDDARIVELVAVKRYPNEGADALDVPGAVIRIRRIE